MQSQDENWHSDQQKRISVGDAAETEWADSWRCLCGGRFRDLHTYGADFTCEYCGLLIDIKTSPATEKFGNITISEIPFDNMPEDEVIVARRAGDSDEAGRWIACLVRDIAKIGPFESTHRRQTAGPYKPTRFYKVSLRTFIPAEAFGFNRTGQQGP